MLTLSDCKIIIADWLWRTAFISSIPFSNSFTFIMTIDLFCAAYKQQTGKEKKWFAHKNVLISISLRLSTWEVKYKILIYPDPPNEWQFPNAAVIK